MVLFGMLGALELLEAAAAGRNLPAFPPPLEDPWEEPESEPEGEGEAEGAAEGAAEGCGGGARRKRAPSRKAQGGSGKRAR